MKIRVLLQLDLGDLSKLSLRVLGISLGLHVHDLHFFIFWYVERDIFPIDFCHHISLSNIKKIRV